MSRPFRIFAFCANRALGDFILQNVFAASVKQSFENARLTVYYQEDRPYKPEVLALNPHIDQTIKLDSPFPIDWFDTAWMAPYQAPDSRWYDLGMADVDLLLVPSMMDWLRLGSLPSPALLQFPPQLEASYEQALAECGVARDRWLACIHTKEGGYKFRPNSGGGRNVDPSTYWKLAKYIVEELGGQVVRLGDPSMWTFPPCQGIIDLSRVEDAFLLHAYAVSRSRFLIAADSGIHPLGSALGVPTGVTNFLSPAVPWHEHDVVLTKTVIAPDGKHYRQEEAHNAQLLFEAIGTKGCCLIDNSVDELCATARDLYAHTTDCTTWRQDYPVKPITARPNRLKLPLEPFFKARWLALD